MKDSHITIRTIKQDRKNRSAIQLKPLPRDPSKLKPKPGTKTTSFSSVDWGREVEQWLRDARKKLRVKEHFNLIMQEARQYEKVSRRHGQPGDEVLSSSDSSDTNETEPSDASDISDVERDEDAAAESFDGGHPDLPAIYGSDN